MSTDEIAIALVKLYAEYMHYVNDGVHNDDYAEATAVAVRILAD